MDFIEYVADLTPDLQAQTLDGKVKIAFRLQPAALCHKTEAVTLVFSIADIKIKDVSGDWLAAYKVKDNKLFVELNDKQLEADRDTFITVEYSAAPQEGVIFADDYVYTRYHTQNWMVSHQALEDTAKFDLTLHLPLGMQHVANGELVSSKPSKPKGNVLRHRWRESRPRPTFTFGFAAGNFKEKVLHHGNRQFRVLYLSSTAEEIDTIFADIGKAYDFFEEVSGLPLPAKNYTFVVTEENSMQEASGFSLVGRKYLHHVLSEPRESWLATHELAHEWWGNAISASSWNDFWLNEGLVQFLVAAFKEKVYGRDEYDREMIFFKESILRRLKNNVFLPAVSPHKTISYEEYMEKYRGTAYSKGAFLFHMLRLELGEKDFWRAIKHYSSRMWEKGSSTRELRLSFEQATGRDLSQFFDTWIHEEQRLELDLKLSVNSDNLLQITLDQLQQQARAFPLQIQVENSTNTALLTFQVSQKQQHFTRQLPGKPSSIRVDPRHYLPLLVKSDTLQAYLPQNLTQAKTTVDRYWSMKALVNSVHCQNSADFIEAELSKFAQSGQARILQTAAQGWLGKCAPGN
ncbi:MAG: hypothetical protein KTR17_09360 [Cellvibrionaceae bacterium]|nr:hypothetical protein [Cellvibrionaceae bacterium]